MKPEGTEPHYVIPISVYEEHKEIIDKVTSNEFNPNAMYNIVFLYTDPKTAAKVGTAVYGSDPVVEYSAAVSRLLGEVWEKADAATQLKSFQGVHAYLRDQVWRNKPPGGTDPCASKNPLPPKPKKKRFGLF